MNKRHIYLKIEPLNNYSPVAPDYAEQHKYRIDCMSNMDHEDGNIPAAEIERRRLQALVYREYLDANYTILKTDPLSRPTTEAPRWISWALGDLVVKMIFAFVLLLPYGALMSSIRPMPEVAKD